LGKKKNGAPESASMKVHCKYDELLAVERIIPHPQNPNEHEADQIARLAEILTYQGWRYPVKISKLSGFMTSGHGRVLAAKLNGWAAVPVVHQDYDDADMEYADLVADNAIAEWARLNLKSINEYIPNLGPEMPIELLGIKNFVLDPADKEIEINEKELDENIATHQECPSCGYKW
jgi:hypothetical protein